MKSKLSRRQSREQAFFIAFEYGFSNDTIEDICDNAMESRDFLVDDFSLLLVSTMVENESEIINIIERYSKGWKLQRMSKVTVAILKLAVCEMIYLSDASRAENFIGVVINEAVELAKKYSTDKDAAFTNGILGAVAKETGK